MTNRLLFLGLFLVFSLNTFAADFDKDFVCYNILEDGKTVEVAKPYLQGDYEGDYVIPESVEFEGIRYSVVGVEEYAFYKCNRLKSLVLPKTIKYMGENAFWGCDSLKKVDIGDLANWCSIDFRGDLWFSNPISRYQLEHLFVNGKEIIDLVIPDDVEEISRNAFYWCPPIQSLEIPGTVKTIGEDAFYRCYNIKKVILHEGIAIVKKGGLANMGTTTITLPQSIKYLGNNSLNYENTSSHLLNICLQNADPTSIQLDENIGLESAMISVPSGTLDVYKNHSYWGQFTIVEGIQEEKFNEVVRVDYFYVEEPIVKKNSSGLFAPTIHVYPGYQSNGTLTCDFAIGLYQNGQLKYTSWRFWDGWTFTDWKTCCLKHPTDLYIYNIEDGEYQMRLLYKIGDNEWIPMVNSDAVYVDAVVKGDQMTLENRFENGAKLRLEAFSIDGKSKVGHDMTASASITNVGLNRKGFLYLHVNDTVRACLRPIIKPQETLEMKFAEEWIDYIFTPQSAGAYTFKITNGEGDILDQKKLVIPEAEKNKLSLHKIDVDNLFGRLMVSKDNLSIDVEVKNESDMPYDDELKFVTRQIWSFDENGDTLISNNGSVFRNLVVEPGKSGKCHYNYIDYDYYEKINKRPYPPYDGLYSVEVYYYSEGKEVLLAKTPFYNWINPEDYEGKIIVKPIGYSREYGDDDPEIEFSVYGGNIVGSPNIYAEAEKKSPIGHYMLKCERGSVTNGNAVFIDDLMSVKKAPLVVTAESYTRQEGEENPVFMITFDGFKNNETENVLEQQPVASSEATLSSLPGDYPIVVTGGEAQNYDFKYVSGVLTVVSANAIKDPFVTGDPFNVYNLQGQMILSGVTSFAGLAKGTYIINNKVVIVK